MPDNGSSIAFTILAVLCAHADLLIPCIQEHRILTGVVLAASAAQELDPLSLAPRYPSQNQQKAAGLIDGRIHNPIIVTSPTLGSRHGDAPSLAARLQGKAFKLDPFLAFRKEPLLFDQLGLLVRFSNTSLTIFIHLEALSSIPCTFPRPFELQGLRGKLHELNKLLRSSRIVQQLDDRSSLVGFIPEVLSKSTSNALNRIRVLDYYEHRNLQTLASCKFHNSSLLSIPIRQQFGFANKCWWLFTLKAASGNP
mmetsp:Transcript_21566/g.73953  ORF Transcript_21566/g.73953 Transcript_21566/m.73953 type:complete len:253 (+) Transcript_21566:428-1186(+)